jgi:hypothetical protein
MKSPILRPLAAAILMSSLMWGCATGPRDQLDMDQFATYFYTAPQEEDRDQDRIPEPSRRKAPAKPSKSLTVRPVTEEELSRIAKRDPDLSPSVARHILARINTRAPYYIAEDIKNGRAIKVPNDFSAFKDWTPLPKYIPAIAGVPKFIVIVKEIPFAGWYERGRLVGDSHACIGRTSGWTEAGLYTVKDKVVNKVSRSYTNAYGQPSPMPWALRIYGLVWIHAGDITDGNCSRGCINLPLLPAVELFKWADSGTPVLVLESLKDLDRELQKNNSDHLRFAVTSPQPVADLS